MHRDQGLYFLFMLFVLSCSILNKFDSKAVGSQHVSESIDVLFFSY